MRRHRSPRVRGRQDCLRRDGGVAVITGIVLLVLMGFAALSIDLGYLMLTTTEMQAASDSASLAGGTELLPGLGKFATQTPAQVEAAARPVAQAFAAANKNADQVSTYIDQSRDVEFGQAVFDEGSGAWVQTIGATPYNMVRATVPRDQVGSSSGDRPVPLFFARAMGHQESTLSKVSAAVIMPANGFAVSDPEGGSSAIMPFAFKEKAWRRFEQAQNWYRHPDGTTETIPSSPEGSAGPTYDPIPDDGIDQQVSVFFRHAYDNQGDLRYDSSGNPIWEQDVFDNFNASPAETTDAATVSGGVGTAVPDGWLEVDLYPESTGGAITAGNAGTVDLGDTDNAAQAIADQIVDGLTFDDYQAMDSQGMLTDGQFILDPDQSIEASAEGDTGLSGGPIQQAMDQIIGETRAILLYSEVAKPGNNAIYTLVEFVGIRVLHAKMSGNDKSIWIQMAPHQDGTAVPDLDTVPGPNTTVFTPLILIE